MSRSRRNLWHPAFALAVQRYGPSGLQIQPEFVLGIESLRLDMLLSRRAKTDGKDAKILKGLWKYLPRRVTVELKTTSLPHRPGDFVKLLAYTALYDSLKLKRLRHRRELAMVFVTPYWTRSLEAELQRMDWEAEALEPGYFRVHGPPYEAFLVVMDQVAEAEMDPVLALFAGSKTMAKLGPVPGDIGRELVAFLRSLEMQMDNSEDYVEIAREVMNSLPYNLRMDGIPEEVRLQGISTAARLQGIPTEERLQGIPTEARLQDVPPERVILALPTEALRALSAKYIATLPEDLQTEIRRRLKSE